MTDIVLELFRAAVIGALILALTGASRAKAISRLSGWRPIVAGFILIFFGTVIDITDNFEELNRFVIVGNTEIQAFLEKVVGYLLGFLLLTLGIWRWLPSLIEYDALTRNKLEVQEERLKVFRATMRTVQDIMNTFLNNVQLFRLEAEEKNALKCESLALMDSVVKDTAAKLKKLADLDSIHEKQLAVGMGIDYEMGSGKKAPDRELQPAQKNRAE